MSRAVILSLSMLLVLASTPVQASDGDWAGATASYQLISENETTDGVTTRSQLLTVQVVDSRNGLLILDTTLTEDGVQSQARYSVPIAVAARAMKIRGGAINRTETVEGTDVTVTGRVAGAWVESLDTVVTRPDGSRFTLSVTLQNQTALPPIAGSAVMLVPSLFAPNEGVSLIQGVDQAHTEDPDPAIAFGDAADATVMATAVTKYAYSDIRVRDNRAANITVAYSDLQARGYVNSSGLFYNWGGALGTSTSANWWLDLKRVSGGLASSRVYAVVDGDANFSGIFPLSTCTSWRTHNWHRHRIYTSQHATWLQSTIWTNCGGGVWSFWKQSNFYTGQAFASGSRQKGLHYIID